MQLLGMRQTAVVEPEFLIETLDVHNQRVSLPLADGAAVVERVVRVTVDLADLDAPIGPDFPPIAVTAGEQYPDAAEVGILDKLESVNLLVLARSSGRFAKQIHRIVFQEIALAILVQVSRPFLHGSDLVDICDV